MLRVALFDNSSAKCLIINPFENAKIITKATRCSVPCIATVTCIEFCLWARLFRENQIKSNKIGTNRIGSDLNEFDFSSQYTLAFRLNLGVSYIVSYHPGTHNVSIIVIFCLKRSSICRYPSNV